MHQRALLPQRQPGRAAVRREQQRAVVEHAFGKQAAHQAAQGVAFGQGDRGALLGGCGHRECGRVGNRFETHVGFFQWGQAWGR
ncbi:hypothetical protein FQZ97_1126180 [compost metagenome]